ncbi:MAG: hypothetical protein J2P48_20425, partial [Alphaproteobacteria bacterium]|nr:hypothetical protein [Alphaproteobacteria bacterium]
RSALSTASPLSLQRRLLATPFLQTPPVAGMRIHRLLGSHRTISSFSRCSNAPSWEIRPSKYETS